MKVCKQAQKISFLWYRHSCCNRPTMQPERALYRRYLISNIEGRTWSHLSDDTYCGVMIHMEYENFALLTMSGCDTNWKKNTY
jgi:hypothetical protein